MLSWSSTTPTQTQRSSPCRYPFFWGRRASPPPPPLPSSPLPPRQRYQACGHFVSSRSASSAVPCPLRQHPRAAPPRLPLRSPQQLSSRLPLCPAALWASSCRTLCWNVWWLSWCAKANQRPRLDACWWSLRTTCGWQRLSYESSSSLAIGVITSKIERLHLIQRAEHYARNKGTLCTKFCWSTLCFFIELLLTVHRRSRCCAPTTAWCIHFSFISLCLASRLLNFQTESLVSSETCCSAWHILFPVDGDTCLERVGLQFVQFVAGFSSCRALPVEDRCCCCCCCCCWVEIPIESGQLARKDWTWGTRASETSCCCCCCSGAHVDKRSRWHSLLAARQFA